ncbi:NAD(P)/FAD-dependent oxidoreductase [Saccharibacillus sp. CPCC 101409]|uniref:NAD(P)/FAD-dependent oxidoreductase n=1 Tax=Saccharibacillus sp. CPCC 101409 TaxID=3058041 RepID=UPI002671EA51|nr:NAD(P)/FAD-dependent oxidoreductase [Saccharibacillus sp. CPCC 101409]MDO3412207.1 NAD(P)/FAD-dependent oxidoreductase [Saccharibacillus sp. CPCC 101409]
MTLFHNNPDALLDVLIIGGGPAGMSAALVLGRARRSVLVIDEALPRHRVTKESHGFLTRDGVSPSELRRVAREQIAAYPTVSFVQTAAVEASGEDGNFNVTTTEGKVYRGRKLLFAAGMKDLPMEIDGLKEVYGSSAFVCPYCDGWEMQDRALAIIAGGEFALHLTKTVSGWSSDLALFTNGFSDWEEGVKESIEQRGIPVYESPIRRIESTRGKVRSIVLEDGTEVERTGIFFAPRLAPGTDLPKAMGCETEENGSMIVDEFKKSNIPGIYGAGDGASRMYQVAASVAAGSIAAAMMNSELLESEWQERG